MSIQENYGEGAGEEFVDVAGETGLPGTPVSPAFDASPVISAVPALSAPSDDSVPAGGVVLRRGTTVRMIDQPSPVNDGVVLQRTLLQPQAGSRRQEITRNRKIVGNLPDWSPTPPGEATTVGLRRRS